MHRDHQPCLVENVSRPLSDHRHAMANLVKMMGTQMTLVAGFLMEVIAFYAFP